MKTFPIVLLLTVGCATTARIEAEYPKIANIAGKVRRLESLAQKVANDPTELEYVKEIAHLTAATGFDISEQIATICAELDKPLPRFCLEAEEYTAKLRAAVDRVEAVVAPTPTVP